MVNNRLAWQWVLVLGICLATTPALAGGGPNNVAVVVNSDSWASLAVANAYIQLRRIPPDNVIYLSSIEQIERTDVDRFRQQILLPVLGTLEQRGLLPQIDCIAYSSDLPTAISVNGDVGDEELPKVLTKTASINGLTYLYERVIAKDADYLQLNTNRYMRRPLLRVVTVQMTASDRKQYGQAMEQMTGQQWQQAVDTMAPLVARYGNAPELLYNHACALARTGQADAAEQSLAQAVKAGWADARKAEVDPDFETLRKRKSFQDLLQAMVHKAQAGFRVQGSTAFRSQYSWDAQGATTTGAGEHYMMSTVLAVTSGRGNSVGEAIRCLQRSAAADGTAPKGTIYFMVNSNVRSTTRSGAFAATVKALRDLGVKAEQVNGSLPQDKPDVAGVMIGSATFHWQACGSTILPGAICEHLTSLGGVMREGGGQTPLSELIRYGAAGASGTVTEPYAIQAKFPFPFMHVHYARGCSLAESFYQSVYGPYQLLIVGDPLCQPWAQRLVVSTSGIAPNDTLKKTVQIQREAVTRSGTPAAVDHYECYVDGKRFAATESSDPIELDTTVLADGWHEITLVAVAAGPIETQSSVVIPVNVANRGDRVEFANEGPAETRLDRTIRVRAKCTGAQGIAIIHNARRIALIPGAGGTAEILAQAVGLGKVKLQAVAQLESRFAVSQPLTVNVMLPEPLAPAKSPPLGTLSDGLLVQGEGGKATVVTDVRDSAWLRKAGVTARQRFTVKAWFSVPATDAYQFQFHGTGVTRIRVDDMIVWTGGPIGSTSSKWQMAPANLAAGWHRFELDGLGAKTPRLGIRFGGAGCRGLDAKQFRHELR